MPGRKQLVSISGRYVFAQIFLWCSGFFIQNILNLSVFRILQKQL